MLTWIDETPEGLDQISAFSEGGNRAVRIRVESFTPAEHKAVVLDALNVHEQTGLTPAQLQARVAELEAALREYRGYAHHSDAGNTLSAMRHFEKFESELARLLP